MIVPAAVKKLLLVVMLTGPVSAACFVPRTRVALLPICNTLQSKACRRPNTISRRSTRPVQALMPTPQIEDDLIGRAREKLGSLVARLALPRTTWRVEFGHTKSEILRVAKEEQADLIVLGSRERHGLAILMNFTEDTVLHAAHCDVLAVRLK